MKNITLTIPEFDDKNCGLEVVRRDGSAEQYDPVTNGSVVQDGAVLKINNTYHDYEEDVASIKKLRTYQP